MNEEHSDIATDELWRRGCLFWKLHDAQLLIYENLLENTNRLYVGNCSRRFGKSFLMVLYSIERCLQKKNTKVRYGAAFQTDLKEFIIPAFDLILQDCPEDIKPQYKSNEAKYIFKNGSEIKLFGVDKNPNAGRGNALDYVILDEAGFMDKLDYIIKSVIYPAMKNRPNAKLILISTPPVSPDHDFKQYCEEAQSLGSYSEFTVYDNPLFDEETIQECIDECGGEDTTTFKREYLCQFVVETDRAIIPEFSKQSHVGVIDRDEYYQYYTPYVAMDLGFKDNTALIFGYYDFKRATLVIEDEFVINGHQVTSKNIAENVRQIEESLGYESPYRIADNSDLIFLTDLQSSQDINFLPTNKDSLEAMVNEVRTWMKQGRVKINPKCEILINSLANGIWDKQRKQFDRSKVYGHYDSVAALIYLIRNINTHKNPIPVHHGMRLSDAHIPFELRKDKELEVFKNIFNAKK